MKPKKILLLFALLLVLLALLCIFFPKEGITLGKTTLRMPTLGMVMHQDELVAKAEIEQLVDTLPVEEAVSEAERFIMEMEGDSTRFWIPDNDPHFFEALYEKLSTAKTNHRYVRILHYGDSQIEMDRISNRIRTQLQREFGGGGPGMMPIAPIIPTMTMSHYASGEPQRQSPFGDTLVVRAHGNYGPMVQSHRLAGSVSATFTIRNKKEHNLAIQRVKLLFNNRPGPISATLKWKDASGSWQSIDYSESEAGVHSMEWELDTTMESVRLNVNGSGDIYGVMLDGAPGVAVDNIPMRGCSGQQFTQINRDQLASAYALMDVGLIIMQFGGNSVPYLKYQKSIDTYCEAIGKQIDRLKECCPGATILFVGPSDMSERYNGNWRTYPHMEQVIQSLIQTVNAHGAAYWSIYHAMGGNGSMERWHQQGLSGVDHVHFSQKGADKMGDIMGEALLKYIKNSNL